MAKLGRDPIIAAISIALITTRVEAADPHAQAREHYDRAVQHFSQRDYPAALHELRRTLELRPHYRLHRNLAQVHLEMRDYAAAHTENRLYLEQGGDKIPPERRQEVTDEMMKLAQLVAMVTVTVDVPGSVVQVDNASVGQTPLQLPIVLNVGQHQLVVSHPRYPSQSKLITAVAGASERVEFLFETRPERTLPGGSASPGSLDGRGDAPDPTSASPLAPQSTAGAGNATHDDSRDYLWIGWVATGVLAAGATATGLWALSGDGSLADDRRRAESDGNGNRDQLISDASRLRTLATVTDVLWVAAAAAGGVTLWLTLDSAKSEQRGASEQLALQAGVGPQGVSVRARF